MYSIWAEPISKDTKYLLRVICNLGQKYGSPTFNPHITVYSGVQNVSTAKSAIQSCKNVKKFTVKATGLAFSDNLWKTVFVNMEKNQKLKQLYDTIKKNIPHSPKYEFNPHISLMYKLMSDSEKQVAVDGLKIKQRFTFDKITIVTSSKNVEKWKVVDRVFLN